MKWFVLLIMAAAAGTIFYFRDEIRGKIDEATSTESKTPKGEVVAKGDGGSNSKTKTKTPNGLPSKRKTGIKEPPIKPVVPHTEEEENDAAAKRYPMPRFKTIEQAVGNWQSIPPSAFPRQIVVNKPVKIVLPGGAGSSTVKAGEKVFALAARASMLTIGRTNTASIRGQIGIDDTNFKQVLGKEFDTWKQRQRLIVTKKRERYRNVLAQTSKSSGSISRNEAGLLAYEKELGKKPEQLANGQVPIMIASLKRKDVSEITLDIIEGWGPVIREEVDGKYYWTATVEYKTVSMFGELNTEAQALMRNGKVLQWVYTGSGESVP